MNKKIILVGGSGFIGKSLTNQLMKTAIYDKVLIVGRREKLDYELPNGVFYKQCDILNQDFIRSFISSGDHVIDLSYSTVPKTSFDDPLLEVSNNIPANVKLMDSCSKIGVGKYVYVSSGGTVYGNCLLSPISEEMPTNPISPYGISKLLVEKFAFFYHINYQLPVIIVRPSNPYGVVQVRSSPQGFIGNAISNLLQDIPMTVFGQSGTVRDYLYVDDLSLGIIDCLLRGKIANIYNIGSSIGINNIELLEMIEQVFNKKFSKINFLQSRPFDVKVNILSIAKLNQLTNWKPRVDILSGLKNIREKINEKNT